jgi:hypothetical protein
MEILENRLSQAVRGTRRSVISLDDISENSSRKNSCTLFLSLSLLSHFFSIFISSDLSALEECNLLRKELDLIRSRNWQEVVFERWSGRNAAEFPATFRPILLNASAKVAKRDEWDASGLPRPRVAFAEEVRVLCVCVCVYVCLHDLCWYAYSSILFPVTNE